jgi:hypothetical protein
VLPRPKNSRATPPERGRAAFRASLSGLRPDRIGSWLRTNDNTMKKNYYIGLDVHKETIAIAYTKEGSRKEPTYHSTCGGSNPAAERALRSLARKLKVAFKKDDASRLGQLSFHKTIFSPESNVKVGIVPQNGGLGVVKSQVTGYKVNEPFAPVGIFPHFFFYISVDVNGLIYLSGCVICFCTHNTVF